MKIKDIIEITNCNVLNGAKSLDLDIEYGFASDLMSDVLTVSHREKLILITGLTNIQTVRTAEMADISAILFVRDKKISEEILELGKENNIILLESKNSMFKTIGLLYEKGLKPVY